MSISSFLPSYGSSALPALGATPKTPTPYDINAAQFGPVAATAIGVAAQATDMASATASFSSEGLKKFSDLAGSALQSVEGAVSGIGSELASFGHTVEDDVKKAYGVVTSAATSVVSGVEDAVSSVESTVSSVATSIGNAATSVKDEVSSVAGSAASYLALGLNALA